jgi:MSHA biogenesis protein MshM
VVGEVGTGKTLLCRRLLAACRRRTVTAYLPNPSMSPRGLMAGAGHELRLDVPARASEYETARRASSAR